jgi:hypothetical protein
MNRRWLIPVFFLILAALACDTPYYDPPHVSGVKADPDTSGRVYATVSETEAEYICSKKPDGSYDYSACAWTETSAPYVYRSDDYGQTWQRTDEMVDTESEASVILENETLYHNGVPLWSFPRPGYRSFFLNDEYGSRFNLRHAGTSSSTDGVLYVGMGTEGVLSFLSPDEWYLSAAGIAELNPLPLTVTNPLDILGTIALALLIPPLPLIHAYMLSRIWMYVMPMGRAWRLAGGVSLFLALLAALAIAIWLTDANTDYYPMVAVMTAITVFVSVTVAWVAAPEDRAGWLARRTLPVALIVPIGVAAIWFGWIFVIPVITAYAIFRGSYALHLRGYEGVNAWLVDRLALTSLGIAAVCGFAVWLVIASLASGLLYSALMFLLAWIIAVVWSALWLKGYATREMERIGWHTTSLQARLSTAAVLCYALPAAFAVATFWGQASARGWFTDILMPR